MTLKDLLSEAEQREVKSGVTAYGPHKAELQLTFDGKALRDVASRGQGKMVALAMILSQAELIAAGSEQRSVFLLDDVFAELDADSLDRLIEGIETSGSQVFLTSPGSRRSIPRKLLSREGSSADVFHVKQGVITREKN